MKNPLLVIFVLSQVLAIACIFIGAMFKLQHWSGASQLMVIGISLQVASLFLGAYLIIKHKLKS